MKRPIYLYRVAEDGYENYLMENENDDDVLRFLTGDPLGSAWKGAKVSRAQAGSVPSDFPSFIGATPLFSARAWEALSDYVSPFVEALPVRARGKQMFYAINVLAVYDDVFDADESKFAYNPYSRSISAVYAYSFKNPTAIRSPIFKARETQWIDTYLTGDFLDFVRASKLIGLDGIRIYPGQT
jgi:hypothetical protein